MGVDQQSWGEYLAGAEWRGEDLDKLNALPDEEKAKLVNQMKTQQEAADKVYRAEVAAKENARVAAQQQEMADEHQNNLPTSYNPFEQFGGLTAYRDTPTFRRGAANNVIQSMGLNELRNDATDLANAGYFDSATTKMQEMRKSIERALAEETDQKKREYATNALVNIDLGLKDVARRKQEAQAAKQFYADRKAYEEGEVQAAITGQPNPHKNPGNPTIRAIGDGLSGAVRWFNKEFNPFTDEYGNYYNQANGASSTQPAQQAEAQQTTKAEEKPAQQAEAQQTTKAEEKPAQQAEAQQTTKTEEKPAQQAQTTQAVQQVIPTQSTQQVYQRPAEPPVKMGANGYPVYEQLPNGGYRYDTTYLDPQGKVDPYAMPNGIRGDFGDQEAYWNLRNRATSAKARYEQSQAANLQGEATTGLLQVQADPETHKRAQEYMQSGMALNAQEALNLATVEQAQRMGIWGAAANAYAPMQQSLDNAQTRNTMAGMYYGADTPYMMSANGYGAHTGMNGVTFNNDGTVNVVAPNGQVIKGVSADRAMAGVAAGSPQAAAAARYNAVTGFNRVHNGLYGIPGMYGAPTNAAAVSYAAGVSKAFAKDDKKQQQQPTQSTTYAHE